MAADLRKEKNIDKTQLYFNVLHSLFYKNIFYKNVEAKISLISKYVKNTYKAEILLRAFFYDENIIQ